MHIELFLEEPSAEAFMQGFLPKILPDDTTWKPIVFQGKGDLLKNLEKRLKGYKRWIPADYRIVVLIDEDRADCRKLKLQMEEAAASAGLMTKTAVQSGSPFAVLNRVAIEELEAWYIGDPEALVGAYPRVPASLGSKAKYRDPDAVAGGTWEALERVLQRAGYFKGGFSKIELARTMGVHMVPARNTSRSFQRFISGIACLQTGTIATLDS